ARCSRPCARARSFRAASSCSFRAQPRVPNSCDIRGANDASKVPELRDTHLATGIKAIDEPGGVLHDPSTDDEELGPDQIVQGREITIEAPAPTFPAQALLDARRVRYPSVADVPSQRDVPELGVRDEHAILQERSPDTSAHGDEHDDAGMVACRAE